MEAPKNVFEEDQRPSKELRVLAAVCYIPFGFVLPYFLEKSGEDFVVFHLRQAIAMFVVMLLASIFLWGIFWYAYLIIGGYTAYRAYTGDKFIFGFIKKAGEILEKTDNGNKQ